MKIESLEKCFKYYHLIFFGLLSILLIFSFDFQYGWILNSQFPEVYLFTFNSGYKTRASIIWMENGFIEIFQTIIIFISLLILIKFFFLKKNINKKIISFLLVIFFGLIYIFLEEISWGQHFFNFKTPEILLKEGLFFNKQGETNLHNISNLFNQIPRNLVLFWCSLSIIFCRLFFNKSSITKLVEPNKKLIILSLIILAITISVIIVTKFGLNEGEKFFKDFEILNNDFVYQKINLDQLFFSIFAFDFIRFSELQELLFYNYFLWYVIFLTEYLNILSKQKQDRSIER